MPSSVDVYRVCDIALGSAIPLPELPRVTGVKDVRAGAGVGAQWTFRLRRHRGSKPAPEGTHFVSMVSRRGGYILRFSRLADFAISLRRRTIECVATPRTPLYTLRHLLLDHVVPLLLSTEGRLVLHASAVAGPRGAIAFMGLSGSGKSTLALRLAREGYPIVADDFLPVDDKPVDGKPVDGRPVDGKNANWLVVPSYASMRLWPETVRTLVGKGSAGSPVRRNVGPSRAKQRLDFHSGWRFHDGATALHRVYMLAPRTGYNRGGEVSTTPLTARAAMIALVKSAFQMGADPRVPGATFDLAARVAESVGVRQLQYPRNLARMDDILLALRNDAAL